MPHWVDEKTAAEDKSIEASSSNKEREASPPPLYGAPSAAASETRSNGGSSQNAAFPVPFGAGVGSAAQAYAPPPGPPPGVSAPSYEPFDFRAAWSANQPNGKAQYGAPTWHKVPSYYVHIHKETMEPLYRCDLKDSKGGRSVVLTTINEDPNASYDAVLAANKALLGGKYEVKTSSGDKTGVVVRTKQAPNAVTFNDGEGRELEWTALPGRHELVRKQDQALIAVLHLAKEFEATRSTSTANLELTAFAWSRMPQDGLYCDVDGCPLNPIFGFVFRCQSCSDANLAADDTFDVCEAHLEQAAREHNPNHRFVRIPRIYAPPDSDQEPLLSLDQLLSERRQLEVVLLTLGVALLQKS